MGSPTPKAILNRKYGNLVSYKVEEVQESNKDRCPGLIIPQRGPPLYRCKLELPTLTVTSELFKKKKDAEQDAAQLALTKLGILLSPPRSTTLEPWDAFTNRLKYLFSNELISSDNPLSCHIRAAFTRGSGQHGLLLAIVLASFDSQISSLCKSMTPQAEFDPLEMAKLVRNAARSLPDLVVTDEKQLTLRRCSPYAFELDECHCKSEKGSSELEIMQVVVIVIPTNELIWPRTLHITLDEYYLDAIAKNLGQMNANNILLSRGIGNVSSHIRLHYAVTDEKMLDIEVGTKFDLNESVNKRASFLSGQRIYGDAIMACIGYSWKSRDLAYENLSLQSYYRMVIRKTPCGNYRFSRDAILVATLPKVFTTKINWKGSWPRELLCSFCRQHRLLEPEFSILQLPPSACSNKNAAQLDSDLFIDSSLNDKKSVLAANVLQCRIKLTSKFSNFSIECSPKDVYTKEHDSINNTALRLLSWLNTYFEDFDNPLERLRQSASTKDISFDPGIFSDIFIAHPSESCAHHFVAVDQVYTALRGGIRSLSVENFESDASPSIGSMVCIRYAVYLVTVDEAIKELLESKDEFEFEVGIEGVIPQLEDAISQLSVGQSACFVTDLPRVEFILSASGDASRISSLLSSEPCYLQYLVTLLSVAEPPEEKMEQAFFNPTLSKQRVQCALHHITKSVARTLVDFGCGAGSLLHSLLNHQINLKKIVGVDISPKGLVRAAKILHSRLNENVNASIESVILYNGDILKEDPMLCKFDIGTCLEVIEHMKEEEAWQFGDIALGHFCPKILLVSTPNFEYNVILKRSPAGLVDKDEPVSIHYRNNDHKFEWTREQFQHWASVLAEKHNYGVEFSGVGGSAEVEPGFASQIAIFTRNFEIEENRDHVTEPSSSLELIWNWSSDATQ